MDHKTFHLAEQDPVGYILVGCDCGWRELVAVDGCDHWQGLKRIYEARDGHAASPDSYLAAGQLWVVWRKNPGQGWVRRPELSNESGARHLAELEQVSYGMADVRVCRQGRHPEGGVA